MMIRSSTDNQLYIKRDDLYPAVLGGNKARKGELFFCDLRKKNADYVVTYGTSTSNHCRAIACLAAQEGIGCRIISPEESQCASYNQDVVILAGAEIVTCPILKVSETIERNLQELKAAGHNPYFIPGGGHGNIGTQAYVEAYQEILDYETHHNMHFDYIFFASGTGTTHAGLVCGKLANGVSDQEIIGISIARPNPRGKQVVLDSITQYCGKSVNPEEVNFLDDYILGGYGKGEMQILPVIRRELLNNGVPLDVTYTGKAFYGMEQYLIKHRIRNKRILFIHTGGTPLFFGDMERLK